MGRIQINNVYRSKIDAWVAILLVGLPIPMLYVSWKLIHTAVPGRWIIVFPILVLGAALPISLLVATKYTITSDSLRIRSGLFKWEIPLHEISTVVATRSPLSSPALSLDRIRIDYGKGKSVMISPLNKAAFLLELQSRNVPVA
jgi:hypothetical protein